MSLATKKTICMVGIFPPPITGMSIVNQHLRECISKSVTPLIINYSPKHLGRRFFTRLRKLFYLPRCLVVYLYNLSLGRVCTIYVGLSGGLGQVYDLIFILICRIYGIRLYIHHHSYLYIDSYSLLTNLICFTSGKDAVHIVACQFMKNDLKALYPRISVCKVISGISALQISEFPIQTRVQLTTVGFLSNINYAKGVKFYFEIAKYAFEAKMPFKFLLAGGYESDEVRLYCEKWIDLLPNVSYVGPKFGHEKFLFYDSIDVFIFPSTYDSEGLVIHEAMSRGVPVIANARACIREIVSGSVGMLVNDKSSFVSMAISMLKCWLANPELLERASAAAIMQFSDARDLNLKKMKLLCNEMLKV